MSYLEGRRNRKAGLEPPLPTRKPAKPIPKQSAKRKAEAKADKDGNGDTALVRFYKDCMKRMTGHCMNCHGRTETQVYAAAIFSICHIMDKRDTVAPSVKTHPLNWVELCPDCHTNFDTPPLEKGKTLWDKREAMGIWPIIKQKLISVWEDLAPEERRHFPDSVRKFIEDNEPFK